MVRLLNLPCSLHVHDSGVPRGPGLMQVSLTDELRMLIRACTYEGVRKRGRHTTTGHEVIISLVKHKFMTLFLST